MFDQLLKALSGGGLGDLEKNAGDLMVRLEKLGADVIGSNGNVIAAVVSVAEDFGTIKQTLADVQNIVADLKSLHATMSATVGAAVNAVPAPAHSPAPAVSVTSILQAVENVAKTVDPAPAPAPTLDPFSPKPLSHVDVQGGA